MASTAVVGLNSYDPVRDKLHHVLQVPTETVA